jgi:hypothetical protein
MGWLVWSYVFVDPSLISADIDKINTHVRMAEVYCSVKFFCAENLAEPQKPSILNNSLSEHRH